MRTKLVLAGLAAATAAALAPSSASAYCEPEIVVIEGGGSGGCRNSCMETGRAYEKTRESLERRTGVEVLPSYWDLFACLM